MKNLTKSIVEHQPPGHLVIYHVDGEVRDEEAFAQARERYEEGLVILVQRRFGSNRKLNYLAVRASPLARKVLDDISTSVISGRLDTDRPFGKTPAERFQEFVKTNGRPTSWPEPAFV